MPASPIRQSGSPLPTQPPVVRMLTMEALMRVRVKMEVRESLIARDPGRLELADGGVAVAVVAFGQQQLRQGSLRAELPFLGDADGISGEGADARQRQSSAGLIDLGVRGLLGHSAPAAQGRGGNHHQAASSVVAAVVVWCVE